MPIETSTSQRLCPSDVLPSWFIIVLTRVMVDINIYIYWYMMSVYIYIVYISLRLCGWLLALGSLNSIAQISQYSLVRLGSEEFTSAESWFLLFKRGKVLYWSFSIVPMTKPRQPIFKSHLGSLVRRKKSFSVDHFCGPSPESAGWGVESYPQAISQKSLGSYWEKGPFTSMISLLKMVIGHTSSYHKLPEAMQTS